MKKWIAALLCAALLASTSGCGFSPDSISNMLMDSESSTGEEGADLDVSAFKVGFILAEDGTAPSAVSRMKAIRQMQKELSLVDGQIIVQKKVAIDKCSSIVKAMVEEDGCDLIISTDPKYQDKILACAREYSNVQFCQEGGEQAKQSKLENMHDFYSRIYEAYYVSGVLAGLKLNAMIEDGKASKEECTVGFVASEESARAISSYTAFLLGLRRENSNASLLVRYVGSSGDSEADAKEASQLVLAGVKMMASYTTTDAVATVCAEHDIPVVGCESSVIYAAEDEAITSAVTDWTAYYTYAASAVSKGEAFEADWCQGYKEHVVGISQLNDRNLVVGMTDEVIKQEKNMCNGKTKVFETKAFTISGDKLDKKLSSKKYKAYAGYVSEGEFHESEQFSAPAFDIIIDGVEISTEDFIAEKEAELKALEESTSTEESTEDDENSDDDNNDDDDDDDEDEE